jgi:hypothetical protein
MHCGGSLRKRSFRLCCIDVLRLWIFLGHLPLHLQCRVRRGVRGVYMLNWLLQVQGRVPLPYRSPVRRLSARDLLLRRGRYHLHFVSKRGHLSASSSSINVSAVSKYQSDGWKVSSSVHSHDQYSERSVSFMPWRKVPVTRLWRHSTTSVCRLRGGQDPSKRYN